MSSSIRLIVRFDSNHGFPVDVTPSTSVEDLKKLIARPRGLSTDDVRVIFCGRELQNHMTIKVRAQSIVSLLVWLIIVSIFIQDYEFDRQSIVHVVRGRANAGSRSRAVREINLGGVGDQLGSIREDEASEGHSEGPQSLAGVTPQCVRTFALSVIGWWICVVDV